MIPLLKLRETREISWALEAAQKSRGITAELKLLVGPVAGPGPLVEDQTQVAGGGDGLAKGTLVVLWLAGTNAEDAKLVITAGRGNGGFIDWSIAAVHLIKFLHKKFLIDSILVSYVQPTTKFLPK